MKLLLDTHIWLWTVLEPHRVGRHLSHELASTENELWLSPISTWEAVTLAKKGRIHLGGDLRQWFSDAVAGIKEAFLTHEIAIEA